MLGYYDNKLCISARELIEEGFMTKAAYEKNVTRRKIKVMKKFFRRLWLMQLP